MTMKTTSTFFQCGRVMALAACVLPLVLASCQNLPPTEQMSDAQREVYVEHRKWDFEAEKRKEIDAENRR